MVAIMRNRPELYSTIADMKRVLVSARVSSISLLLLCVPNNIVFTDKDL